jgi:hypothetical protein
MKRVSDHCYFIYHTLAGKKILAKAKTSLGRRINLSFCGRLPNFSAT